MVSTGSGSHETHRRRAGLATHHASRHPTPSQVLGLAEEAVAAAKDEVSRLQKYQATARQSGDVSLLSHYEVDLRRATGIVTSLSEEVARIKAAFQPK